MLVDASVAAVCADYGKPSSYVHTCPVASSSSINLNWLPCRSVSLLVRPVAYRECKSVPIGGWAAIKTILYVYANPLCYMTIMSCLVGFRPSLQTCRDLLAMLSVIIEWSCCYIVCRVWTGCSMPAKSKNTDGRYFDSSMFHLCMNTIITWSQLSVRSQQHPLTTTRMTSKQKEAGCNLDWSPSIDVSCIVFTAL